MYLVPFSMGPVGGPLSKNGVELTDSAYVAVSMRVMTRVGTNVLNSIQDNGGSFVKCLHSVGHPLEEGQKDLDWPCNPEKVIVAHKPHSSEILSFGSGYGGNSLLGESLNTLFALIKITPKAIFTVKSFLRLTIEICESHKY